LGWKKAVSFHMTYSIANKRFVQLQKPYFMAEILLAETLIYGGELIGSYWLKSLIYGRELQMNCQQPKMAFTNPLLLYDLVLVSKKSQTFK
jgi:hypothetical protein